MQPLPCYKRLLAEAEGWRVLFAVFFAKSVTAGELKQEGADIGLGWVFGMSFFE